jgi:hypothetical protein
MLFQIELLGKQWYFFLRKFAFWPPIVIYGFPFSILNSNSSWKEIGFMVGLTFKRYWIDHLNPSNNCILVLQNLTCSRHLEKK